MWLQMRSSRLAEPASHPVALWGRSGVEQSARAFTQGMHHGVVVVYRRQGLTGVQGLVHPLGVVGDGLADFQAHGFFQIAQADPTVWRKAVDQQAQLVFAAAQRAQHADQPLGIAHVGGVVLHDDVHHIGHVQHLERQGVQAAWQVHHHLVVQAAQQCQDFFDVLCADGHGAFQVLGGGQQAQAWRDRVQATGQQLGIQSFDLAGQVAQGVLVGPAAQVKGGVTALQVQVHKGAWAVVLLGHDVGHVGAMFA